MELVYIPKHFEEYINTEIYLGRRLGKCKIGMINQFSTPVLYIKSLKKPFYGLVSMISGGYYYFDKLSEKESILLNEFMHKKPNFHSYDESDKCSNWSFIFIQYLIDYYHQSNDSNQEVLIIYNNINNINDSILIPDFSQAYKYQNIIDIGDFITNIINNIEGGV